MGVLSHPVEQPSEACGRAGRLVPDKLRLPAFPVERSHRQACGMGGDGVPMVPAQQVQAHVQARRRPGRRHDPSFVHEQHAGVHPDRRISPRQQSGGKPVRGRPPTVKQLRRRQDEGAGADRCDPCPPRVGGAHCGSDDVRHRHGRVVDPGHDDRVRDGKVVERPGRADAEPAGAHLRRLAAHPHVVLVIGTGQADAPKHLAWNRKVKGDHPVDSQDGNGVHGRNACVTYSLL